MIYQHPLAYLMAVEGAALLRAFGGEHDRDFTLARIAEVRAFVEAANTWGDGVTLSPVTTPDGYRTWASTYDQPANQLVDLEQPVVREILRGLPVGIALDVACGTGRHTRYLAELGHRVVGIDTRRRCSTEPSPASRTPVLLEPTCISRRSPITPLMSLSARWRSPTCRTSPSP